MRHAWEKIENNLVGKYKGKRRLGKSRCRWESIIKLLLKLG
jgi:hypothetical protein